MGHNMSSIILIVRHIEVDRIKQVVVNTYPVNGPEISTFTWVERLPPPEPAGRTSRFVRQYYDIWSWKQISIIQFAKKTFIFCFIYQNRSKKKTYVFWLALIIFSKQNKMFRGVYIYSIVFNHFNLITKWFCITSFILLQLINYIRQNVKWEKYQTNCGSRMSSKTLISSQVNPPSQEKSSITDSRCCLGGGHWDVTELLPILMKNCRYLEQFIRFYVLFLK